MARLTLLNAYSKARTELDAGSKARLASLVASCPQAARDDAKLVEAFGAEGALDISKSLWTDNYVFGSLSKETIGRLSAWIIPAVEKPVPLIYKIWLDQKITRCVYESCRTVKCDAGVVQAQSLGSVVEGLFDGPRAAIARFLNLLTYYEMKNRAGVVGTGLADNVLAKLTSPGPIKLHLVGHSFGARLVTAAANHMKLAGNLEFFSFTLLQGAYSHNGLAKNLGAFPDVVRKPTGPIAITHTHNDIACTLFYALASRLSRESAIRRTSSARWVRMGHKNSTRAIWSQTTRLKPSSRSAQR